MKLTFFSKKTNSNCFEVHDGNTVYFVERFVNDSNRLMDETISDVIGPIEDSELFDKISNFIDELESTDSNRFSYE